MAGHPAARRHHSARCQDVSGIHRRTGGGDARGDASCFSTTIMREDRSVLEIIDADYTFVNEAPGGSLQDRWRQGHEMRRVKLDDPRRGGVLGQASILTVTSFPHRTSPVLRGRWILEELLGTEVPPPPPDVPVLNEREKEARPRLDVPPAAGKTPLQGRMCRLSQPHGPARFRPGKLRSAGPLAHGPGRQTHRQRGRLPTGEKFDGPVELKKLLLEKRRPDFLRNLSRKMLGYALAARSIASTCAWSKIACRPWNKESFAHRGCWKRSC